MIIGFAYTQIFISFSKINAFQRSKPLNVT